GSPPPAHLGVMSLGRRVPMLSFGRRRPFMRFSLWSRLFERTHRVCQSRPAKRLRVASFRPSIEAMEDRCLLSTITVINTNDSGPGSFRQALLDANLNPGPDTIDFNIGGGGIQSIALLSALPPITDAVVIDGTSQPGYDPAHPRPMIELNGAGAGFGVAG